MKKHRPWDPTKIYTSYSDGMKVATNIHKVNYETLPFVLLHIKLQCIMASANKHNKMNVQPPEKEK